MISISISTLTAVRGANQASSTDGDSGDFRAYLWDPHSMSGIDVPDLDKRRRDFMCMKKFEKVFAHFEQLKLLP
jgi:hypothetical protein